MVNAVTEGYTDEDYGEVLSLAELDVRLGLGHLDLDCWELSSELLLLAVFLGLLKEPQSHR